MNDSGIVKAHAIGAMFYAARRNVFAPLAVTAALVGLAGCSDADIASRNISTAADNFEIDRRIVFYNGITDSYMLTIEGRCSIQVEADKKKLNVTCKTGERDYKKHYLGLSDNVTYFAEQITSVDASAYHYRVVFKPQAIIPDFDFKGDAGELNQAIRPRQSPRSAQPQSPQP